MTTSPPNVEQEMEKLKDVRHAVKNDISVIIAFTQLVRLNPQDPKADEFLQKIEHRAHSIVETIEKYLSQDVLLKQSSEKK